MVGDEGDDPAAGCGVIPLIVSALTLAVASVQPLPAARGSRMKQSPILITLARQPEDAVND